MNKTVILFWFVLLCAQSAAGEQPTYSEIPACYSDLRLNQDGNLELKDSSGNWVAEEFPDAWQTLAQLREQIAVTDSGIGFDFEDTSFQGSIQFGLLNDPDEVKHNYPVFRSQASIDRGKAVLNLKRRLSGLYDFTGWEETGLLRLGYRIMDDHGNFAYDGKLVLRGSEPFIVDTCIVEGPFVNLVSPSGAVISFETNYPIEAGVRVGDNLFKDGQASTHHEIALGGLQANSRHDYTVLCGDLSETHYFQTAPEPGSRQPFTFAYASDGRANEGGGERNIRGTNAYMIKRIGVACMQREVRFLQLTGDMINGYSRNRSNIQVEYANWKRAAEPFAQYLPFVAGIGNHECLVHRFKLDVGSIRIDRFPFATESAEALFAANFVNPANGPESEDGSVLDPGQSSIDFPPYSETVFYYTYDNVAMIVLNSDYWFSSSVDWYPHTGGNPHGFIMDNQLNWLRDLLEQLEQNDAIDHIFVTMHTPVFPAGGHVSDDMWYDGDNSPRPIAGGKAASQGVIERRDELLDLLVNQSSKFVATLTGDEHNYCVTKVVPDMPIHPEGWQGDRLQLSRGFWHINNGAGGAPYYGQERTIWEDHVVKFSTQNALVLIHVDGRKLSVETINPDTMELIDRFDL